MKQNQENKQYEVLYKNGNTNKSSARESTREADGVRVPFLGQFERQILIQIGKDIQTLTKQVTSN